MGHRHCSATDSLMSESVQGRLGRWLVKATDKQMDSMEASSPASSQSDQDFVWTPSIMRTKSNIKIDDAEYCHPFPSRMDSSQCSNFFRCKLGVDYKSANDVYCLRCCKKLKSKSGEPIKYSFHTLKWHSGYATSHLMKHVHQYHKAELNIDQESPAKVTGQSSAQHKNISDALVPVMSRSHRSALTKDLVRNLVFEDKEPFSVFERPGFRKCVERLNPAYTLPSRQTFQGWRASVDQR